MKIRTIEREDLPAIGNIWNACQQRGETLLRPFRPGYFCAKFLDTDCYEPPLCLAATEENTLVGVIAGARKHTFLPHETEENTPGFITLLLVLPEYRNRGVGRALLSALENAFRQLGKRRVDVSSVSPVDLHWIIPGTPGHEHNNMPGLDVDGLAYGFLSHMGYRTTVREVAMYLNLSEYRLDEQVEEKRRALAAQGITAGRYSPDEHCEWDAMCDRVGSEYWRKVLKDELASPSPRPILAARTGGQIVGFTGPVDLEESGRGWFTGICTDPLYERRGIATVLFNDLMKEFIRIGAAYASLFTGVDNHAQRLYLKTGFRPVRSFAMLRKDLT